MVLFLFTCKILDTYHINGVYLHLFTSYFDVKSMAQGFDPSLLFFFFFSEINLFGFSLESGSVMLGSSLVYQSGPSNIILVGGFNHFLFSII